MPALSSLPGTPRLPVSGSSRTDCRWPPLAEAFTPRDLRLLAERGIAGQEAERQLELLRRPPRPFLLERPCRLGDGIRALEEPQREALGGRFEQTRSQGRALKMVPASGAATRMFADLLPLLEEEPFPDAEALAERARRGDPSARALERLWQALPDLPFAPELEASLARHGRLLNELRRAGEGHPLLAHLLTAEGLGLADLPKGLIPFHRYADEAATPVAEHMAEGIEYLADAAGLCRLHFTVPSTHRQGFAEETAAAGARLGPPRGLRFDVELSVQDPATDTIAATPSGEPFREEDGTLLLRPGGHGALLGNLQNISGDLVFVKNIDNVLPRRSHPRVAHWQQALGGLLTSLEGRCHELLRTLDSGKGAAAEISVALQFLDQELEDTEAGDLSSLPPDQARLRLMERLNRPLRVCGVVRNEGEPGGGPYWVRHPDGGRSRQIVERAEVPSEPGQAEIFDAATHFNPVQIVCSLRDFRGQPFDLHRYADPRAVFIAEKTHQGRPLLALEHPGLWNGAMSRWHTLFVEIPGDLFGPVKTVFDLLRPAHRTA